METEFKKSTAQTVRMQAPLGERRIVTELSEDIELPDYQPEIKRLLRAQASISPADRYLGAGSAECAGTVEYSILYSDAEGAIWCASPSGTYRFSFPIELPPDVDAGEGLLCDVESRAENLTCRVTAPRRVALHCRLRSRAQLWGTRVLPDPVGAEDGMQRLTVCCDSARLLVGEGESFTVGDEILCEQGEGDLRVIAADGHVFVSEVSVGSGTVNCRGEICLKLLCCRETAGETETVRRRIPFAQMVETDGAEVNCEACASGFVQELRVTVGEGRISCEVTARLSVRAARNEALALPRDAYSTKAECETDTRALTVPVLLCTGNGNLSVNHTLTAEETGLRAGATVLDADGTVTLEGAEYERGKYVLVGKCRFRAILHCEGELSVQECEVPIRYEVGGAESGEAVAASELGAEVIVCRARADGERLTFDAELALAWMLRGEQTVTVLTDVRTGNAWQAPSAAYTVCYPAKDDTLWQVAKRYHTAVSVLTAKNALAQAPAADAPDSLVGVRYLLI